MTEFEIATLTANVAIGLGQIGIVWYGIRAMTSATERRAAEARDEARRASRAADQRHAEAMQALREQGKALREQGEALREQGEALREQGEALRASTAALVTLLERTAPLTD